MWKRKQFNKGQTRFENRLGRGVAVKWGERRWRDREREREGEREREREAGLVERCLWL